ncbi:hypothetical protein BRAS3809_7530012 [Bradyrhizobium sp. STM 3809]|nr:hypothetical protein BRAS3809_7530012 [Bradyrhizobium sp. STM 3809]
MWICAGRFRRFFNLRRRRFGRKSLPDLVKLVKFFGSKLIQEKKIRLPPYNPFNFQTILIVQSSVD